MSVIVSNIVHCGNLLGRQLGLLVFPVMFASAVAVGAIILSDACYVSREPIRRNKEKDERQ